MHNAIGTLIVFALMWVLWREEPRREQIKGVISVAIICLVIFGLMGDWFRSLVSSQP